MARVGGDGRIRWCRGHPCTERRKWGKNEWLVDCHPWNEGREWRLGGGWVFGEHGDWCWNMFRQWYWLCCRRDDGFEDGSQFAEGSESGCIDCGKGSSWRWVLEGCDEVVGSGTRSIDGGSLGHGSMYGEPFECISNAFSASFDCVDAVAAVVVGSCTNVPARDAMLGPRFTDFGFLMDNDFGTKGAERSSVEVEGAMKLGLCREPWVDAGWAKEI